MKLNRLFPYFIGLAFFGICAAIVSPIFSHARNNARRATCQSNLKKIALACQQYLSDNDQKFPPLSDGSRAGWADFLENKYLEGWAVFQCPEGYNPVEERSTDYFFNGRLASRRLATDNGAQIISFGEGIDNNGVNSHLLENIITPDYDDKSPTKRHLEGANYAFVDGHVKWLRVGKGWSNEMENRYTFKTN